MRISINPLIIGSPLALFVLSACGGGGGSPGPTPSAAASTPVPIFADHAVAAGDTFSKSGTAWDITNVKTTIYSDGNALSPSDYDYLRVDITFAQTILAALPAPGQALTLGSQLGVSVAIEIAPTIAESTQPFSCVTQVSQDYSAASVVSPRLSDGNYIVASSSGGSLSQSGLPITEAQTSVSGNTVSQIFRLSVLGLPETSTAPLLGVEVAADNGNAIPGVSPLTVTDCAPRNVELFLSQ